MHSRVGRLLSGRLAPFAAGLLLFGISAGPNLAVAAAGSETASAKTWIGHEAELERFLRTVEPVGLAPIGTGVTNPFRAELAPGGPMPAFAWKPIRPGFYGGHYESYRTEIAAYELDKHLELGMVPVTVERRVDKVLGAACMWVTPTQSFRELGGPPKPPADQKERWNIQLIRAKMFDNLIGNRDPNLGNWLVDPAWNILLIDHSRSFGGGKALVHEFERVDADLWRRMRGMTEESLGGALGHWLRPKPIRAILKRRDRMAEIIDELIAANGEDAVLLWYEEPIR
ncbi:MAG: hypothetical protein ACE5GX_10165 [Thermoanaerobaculia bacterium]